LVFYRNTKSDAILGYSRLQLPSAPSGDYLPNSAKLSEN